MGNVGSIDNMLKRIEAECVITSDSEMISSSSAIILPGVGAFDTGMKALRERGLIPLLNKRVLEDKIPVLGICLGMQLMTRGSEEGSERGLSWIDGETRRFQSAEREYRLRIPHMGWNEVTLLRPEPLFDGLATDARFYFVHSYHLLCDHVDDVMTTTSYGIAFHSSLRHANIYGVQFHPEKSHSFGMRLLVNFNRIINHG